MKAQIARGADFETGNIIQKAKKYDSASGSAVYFCVSEEQMIWPWPWKQGAIMEGITEPR